MKFDPGHAADVAVPSACVLVEDLFPQLSGAARDSMIRRVTEFLLTTLTAYCEFHPRAAVPAPSQN